MLSEISHDNSSDIFFGSKVISEQDDKLKSAKNKLSLKVTVIFLINFHPIAKQYFYIFLNHPFDYLFQQFYINNKSFANVYYLILPHQ